MYRFFPGLVLALAGVVCGGVQAQDIEPNNSCQNAQDFGATALPVSVFGALSPTSTALDVDFFRFVLTPGETIRADLEGAPTGQGTLGDPFLGMFDSACSLIAFNDDSGSLNSRLIVEVPADGVVTFGITACCDIDFLGGGVGSYLLSLGRLVTIDSITGRIVNGDTGEPLPGQDFPFTTVQLLRCNTISCIEFVNFQQADGDGRFRFVTDQVGNRLSVGSYQIFASAAGFENFFSEPFDVAEGEALDLGDLPLVRFQLIESVSGRVVDAVSGDPVTGFAPPFAVVFLERCENGGCFAVAGTNPDFDGRFRMDGAVFFISPGTFRLRGFADDYRESVTAEFAIGAFEDVDIGDFRLTPFPIQFGTVQECRIPPGGGHCDFSIKASNRGPGHYRGEAWATVDLFTPGASRNTRFQVGTVGTINPMPQRINLKQGGSTTLHFQLNVPATVLDGSLVCMTITVGRDPVPQFDTQGDRFISCAVKQPDEFKTLSGKEGRRQYRDLTGKAGGKNQ